MTTQEAIDRFLLSRAAKNVSGETIKWYRLILGHLAALYPELPDKTEDLERFLASCRGKDERRHGYYRAVKAFYRWMAKRKFVSGDTILALEAPQRVHKERPYLNEQELGQLLDYPHTPLIKGSLLFLTDSGCRLGELHSLSPDSFYQWSGHRVVRIHGKTGARVIPVSENCYRLLIRHLPFRFKKDWLGRLISMAFKEAEVPGTAHCLRHTVGTLWEGDIDNLQQLLGHSSITTTMIYRHRRLKTLQADHANNSLLRRLPQQLSLW